MKKFASIILAAVLLATMLTVFAVPASADEIIDAYPYPGNYKQDNGYFCIYNVGCDGYLAAKKVGNAVRFDIQDTGDVFQISKKQLSDEKGKENVYAYQITVMTSPVATAGHSLRVLGNDGWPKNKTEITEEYNFGLWQQCWAFDNAGNGQVYIRTYLDNDATPDKGAPGVHPYLDLNTDNNCVCLNEKLNTANQLWVLEKVCTPDGRGLEDDPYLISTADQLSKLAEFIIADRHNKSDVYYKLTEDISYSGAPIGTEDHPFSGIFDGDGHTITLSIDKKDQTYVGLFGVAWKATIENLKIAGYVYGKNCVGGVAGKVYRQTFIENCHVTASVTGTAENVGGIVGWLDYNCSVGGCSVDATVKGGWSSVGGIAGWMNDDCSITSCKKAGETIGESAVGGIAGYASTSNYSLRIVNCSSAGSVTAIKNVGGIIGLAERKTYIDNCHVTASVTGTAENVGGIAGYAHTLGDTSAIENCSSAGPVSGKNCVGGIIGNADQKTLIDNCYVTSSVTGADGNIGGIVGAMSLGKITNCRMDGNVSNTGWTSTGGIVGGILGGSEIYNCVNTGKITADKAVGGILGCVMYGETTIGNCASFGSTVENTNGGGYEHGGIVGFIDSNVDKFTIINSFSICDIGVSRDSGYVIGNNCDGDKPSSAYVYYIAKGNANKVVGTGTELNSSNNDVKSVVSSDYKETLKALNDNVKVINFIGYRFSTWEGNGSVFWPESCRGFDVNAPQSGISSGTGSILSEGSLVIIVGVAAAVVFGLGGFILGTKKKKKNAQSNS